MLEKKKVKLVSGATLEIQLASFAVSKALYQAVLAQLQSVEIKGDASQMELFKNLFCAGFADPAIEAATLECAKRCTINNERFTLDYFEPAERRGDFTQVCLEVLKANVMPFMKSLCAEYPLLSVILEKFQA